MLTRRDFLKATAAAGAALAIGQSFSLEEGLLRAITPAEVKASEEKEQVFINLGTGYPVSGKPLWVYVKNGRIIRVRPARLPADKIQKKWEIKVGDRVFKPIKSEEKLAIGPQSITLRRRVYDPHRIKYPMKRVDWSPTNPNTQNRGKSEFVRISWEEALDTIASELKRVYETYGPSAILQTYYSHTHPGNNACTIHDPYRSVMNRTLCAAFGGHTAEGHSPDSWEGWVYGASFNWGYSWNWGKAPTQDLEDVMKNSKLVIHWANDQLTTSADVAWSEYQPWLKELGIRRIWIGPDFNWSAAAYGDKWIPVLPGTDAALAAAIAYVWITEDSYDKEYVNTHTYGFDKFKDYIMGVEDGVPKTPEWAEQECKVKARIIRALARDWASKSTVLGIGNGTPCRCPYGHEWTRMVALLLAMQGMGKPGQGWWGGSGGEPRNPIRYPGPPVGGNPEAWGNLTWYADEIPINTVPQFVWKSGLPESILNPPHEWYGVGLTAVRPPPKGVEAWFPHRTFDHPQWAVTAAKFTYPEPGYSEVHLIMSSSTAQLTCWPAGYKWIQAYQSPKIEFIFRIDYWWGGEAIYSDILLPACTIFERVDILSSPAFLPTPLHKCVEPLWESKSDFWIEAELAKKLGVYDKVHEGLDEDGWMERIFENLAISRYMSFEEFMNMKGSYPEGELPHYFDFPWNPENVTPPHIPGMRAFAENPEENKLDTKSGKLEFYSQWIEEWFPGDTERPPVPQYKPSWEGLQTPLAKKYPLLAALPHPRYRVHSQFDENPWLREIPGFKLIKDGYAYEALWMNPEDAAARGIKDGDIVRVYNDRGQILCGAYVNDRMIKGAVRAPEGSLYDPVEPGNPYSLDKGGAINILAPSEYQSKNASSMTVSGFLVEVEKWVGPIPESVAEKRLKQGG